MRNGRAARTDIFQGLEHARHAFLASDSVEASKHCQHGVILTSFQGNPLREPPREVHAPVEGHRGPLSLKEPQ